MNSSVSLGLSPWHWWDQSREKQSSRVLAALKTDLLNEQFAIFFFVSFAFLPIISWSPSCWYNFYLIEFIQTSQNYWLTSIYVQGNKEMHWQLGKVDNNIIKFPFPWIEQGIFTPSVMRGIGPVQRANTGPRCSLSLQLLLGYSRLPEWSPSPFCKQEKFHWAQEHKEKYKLS